MTYPGAPTIYYGNEVGVTSGDDPYNRGTYPWADESGKPDMALHEKFKQLTAMRHANPVLRRGSLMAPLHVDDQVVIFAREHQGTRVLVAINNATEARRVSMDLPAGWQGGTFVAALDGTRIVANTARVTLELPALTGKAYIAPPRNQ